MRPRSSLCFIVRNLLHTLSILKLCGFLMVINLLAYFSLICLILIGGNQLLGIIVAIALNP